MISVKLMWSFIFIFYSCKIVSKVYNDDKCKKEEPLIVSIVGCFSFLGHNNLCIYNYLVILVKSAFPIICISILLSVIIDTNISFLMLKYKMLVSNILLFRYIRRD